MTDILLLSRATDTTAQPDASSFLSLFSKLRPEHAILRFGPVLLVQTCSLLLDATTSFVQNSVHWRLLPSPEPLKTVRSSIRQQLSTVTPATKEMSISHHYVRDMWLKSRKPAKRRSVPVYPSETALGTNIPKSLFSIVSLMKALRSHVALAIASDHRWRWG